MKTVKPEEMMHIPLEMITPSDKNPRTIFDEERIAELANSMSALGQLQPIMLRETEDGYTIIVGGRRFMAAQKLGWKTIQATIMPAACVKKLDEADMLFIRLEENLKREALNPLEQAKAFAEAKKLGRSVEDIASRLSLSTRTVYNTIRLLSLSDAMQEMLAAGRITPAHCDRLLRIENEDERQEVFEAVIHIDFETSEDAINTKISCLPFQKMVAVLVVLEAAEYLVPMYWELDSNDQFGEDRRIEIFDTLLSRFGKSLADIATQEKK